MVLLGLRLAALRLLVAELLHRQAWHVFLVSAGPLGKHSARESARSEATPPNFQVLYDNVTGGHSSGQQRLLSKAISK